MDSARSTTYTWVAPWNWGRVSSVNYVFRCVASPESVTELPHFECYPDSRCLWSCSDRRSGCSLCSSNSYTRAVAGAIYRMVSRSPSYSADDRLACHAG
jgi:hypothetical protein